MGALCSLMEECPRLPFSQQRGLPPERHITDCGGYRRDPTHTHRLPRRAVQHCARRGKEKARSRRANRTGWRAMEATMKPESKKPRAAFTGGAHESCGRDSPTSAGQNSTFRLSLQAPPQPILAEAIASPLHSRLPERADTSGCARPWHRRPYSSWRHSRRSGA